MARDDRYYEEEIDYLRRAGHEYALLHPQRADYLRLDDVRQRDPHVERLVESFAFLTGHIRRKLDDELPELTRALMDLVWPHYLRPVPPFAMLQMEPVPGLLETHQHIKAGFPVKSKQVQPENVRCEFRTVYPVDLLPIELRKGEIVTDEAGQRRLHFTFGVLESADRGELRLDRLRLHLYGEPPIAFCAYRLLLRHISRLELRFARDRRRRFTERHQLTKRVRSVGFGEDEALLPYPGASFPAYRLLTEYFAFPEKFLFIDLLDLGPIELEDHQDSFDLIIDFDERPPDFFRPGVENFRLHVTPIINLFEKESDPVDIDHRKLTYELVPDKTAPGAFEVYSVDDVRGIKATSTRSAKRYAFYSFEHDRVGDPRGGGHGGDRRDGAFYHVSQQFSRTGRWTTDISLILPEHGRLPEQETLSLTLTCTNGKLAHRIGGKGIRSQGGPGYEFVRFHNLTLPTEPVYPRLGRGAEWSFLSHMALNHLSLTQPEALRQVLRLYDLEAKRANRRRIESVVEVSNRKLERLIAGAPVRGTEVTLRVDESHFADRGDLLLFSEVLGRFLGLYAAVNSFVELKIEILDSEDVLTCRPTLGAQLLI